MRMWELRKNGVASDPIPEDELERMLEAGTVEGSLAVRPVGKDAWKPAFRHAPFAAAASRAQKTPGSTLMSRDAPAPAPVKDPARWDQQTQLNMPAQPLPKVPAGPPPLPEVGPLQAAPAQLAPQQMATPRPAPVVAVVTAPRLPPPATPAPGFTAGLFDFSFKSFITTQVVKTLYVLFVVLVGLATLGGMMAGITAALAGRNMGSDTALALGLLQIVATPLVSILLLTLGRILCESLVVFFRVAEHLAEIDRKTMG